MSFLLLVLIYPVALVNLTTINIGGEDKSVSACIPVNRNTSLYMSLVDPSCDSKVDIYQSPPSRIKRYQVSFNDTSTGFTYNLTGNVDPEKLIFLYMVSCEVTYSTEIDSPSLLCITIGAQTPRCYSTNDARNSNSRQTITESGSITMFRPQDLLVKIAITDNDRIFVNGSITIGQFYYENISYPEECSKLTIDRPQCQLKSFTNETCILAFSNNSAKLQYGELPVQPYNSSTYTPSITNCSVSPTMLTPTVSQTPTGSDVAALTGIASASVGFTIILLVSIPGTIICFGGYYIRRKKKRNDLETFLYESDEEYLLSTLERRKEADEKGSKKRKK